jgi:two-component system CheB/CheR fusion protein
MFAGGITFRNLAEKVMAGYRMPNPGHNTKIERQGDVQRLQAELFHSEQRLNEALNDVTLANRELRASNEDQQGLNEELRVANEELEASKTELETLNGELAIRVDQLAAMNADMGNVIESSRVAIVFLDETLRIRSFTPAVQDVVHMVNSDCGRPITDLALQIRYPDLAKDARRVLETGDTIERQAGHTARDAFYLVRLLPYRDAGLRVVGVVVTFLDISATYTIEQALRASDDRFRRMAAAVPALLFIATAAMAWEYVNPPFYDLTGQPEGSALGDGWSASLHPEDMEPNRRLSRAAHAAGATLEQEARLRREDGSWCWFLIRAVPQLDPAGNVMRWYGSCTDIDERRRAENRQGKLLVELQHRIKNILAVVRSVLTRTLESSSDLDHFATHLAGRIEALARTQSVAARTAEGFVMLEEIVYQELTAHGGQDERQFEVEGPVVALMPKIADAIGLAIHELTTNSIKYGALASSSGMIGVRWRIEPVDGHTDRDRLFLVWQESGVPLTDLHPRRRGFGRELIEQGLPYELGAATALVFRPGGVRCEIEFSLPNRGKGLSAKA